MAIADGATWAVSSRMWADRLTTAFVEQPPRPEASSVSDWCARLAADLDADDPGHDSESWWGDAAKERGAAAALVGLAFDVSLQHPAWTAIAVGDSCLFHFHRTGITTFPLTSVDEFGSRPDLILTTEPVGLDTVKILAGTAEPGDMFVLATDALSSWIMAELHDPATLRSGLTGVRSDTFGGWIARLRSAQLVPDDDMTFMRVLVLDEDTR